MRNEEKTDNPLNLMTYSVYRSATTGKKLSEIYKEYGIPSFSKSKREKLTEDTLNSLKKWGFEKSVAMRLDIFALLMECGNFTDAHKVIVDLDKLKDLYPAEKKEIDINLPDLTSKIADIIGRTVSDKCPHCKKRLSLKNDTILELEKLSKGLE